jgi:hypothetical protein
MRFWSEAQWAINKAPTPNATMHAANSDQNVIAISLGMAVFLIPAVAARETKATR